VSWGTLLPILVILRLFTFNLWATRPTRLRLITWPCDLAAQHRYLAAKNNTKPQDQDRDLRHQDKDQDQDFSVQDQDQDFQNTVSRPRPKSREPHVWLKLQVQILGSLPVCQWPVLEHVLQSQVQVTFTTYLPHISRRVITKVCVYVYVHSRSISCFILCLTHLGVGDCGQPMSVRRQDEQTEASSVNARHSELLDLPDWYEQRSSSASKSLEYSIKNALISMISNNSSGRSLSFYKNITISSDAVLTV